MANTSNYNLKKVEYTEMADIPAHFNGNMDAIDTQMKTNSDAAVSAENNAKNYADGIGTALSGIIGSLGSLLTTVKTNIVAAINSLKSEVDSHKAETVSSSHYFSRDLTLTGLQTINIAANLTPKSISVIAAVHDTHKFSISIGRESLYSASSTAFKTAANHITIADNDTNRTFGTVKNIRKGAFDIEWTHSGTGATGNLQASVTVTYHGEG